jgi:transcriptional regulator with XRE-family HTH domain
LLSGEEGVTRI